MMRQMVPSLNLTNLRTSIACRRDANRGVDADFIDRSLYQTRTAVYNIHGIPLGEACIYAWLSLFFATRVHHNEKHPGLPSRPRIAAPHFPQPASVGGRSLPLGQWFLDKHTPGPRTALQQLELDDFD